MKIIKKLFISLLFMFVILEFNCIKMEAKTTTETSEQLEEWAHKGDEKFFTTNFAGKTYQITGNYANGYGGEGRSVWTCVNQQDNGISNGSAKVYRVIDIENDNVKVVNDKGNALEVDKRQAEKLIKMAGFVEHESEWFKPADLAELQLGSHLKTLYWGWKSILYSDSSKLLYYNGSPDDNAQYIFDTADKDGSYIDNKFKSAFTKWPLSKNTQVRILIMSGNCGQTRFVYGYRKVQKGNLRIYKKEKGTNTLLKNATFKITGPSNYNKTVTINDSTKGIYLTGLEPGNYTITETKAPPNYKIETTTKTVTVQSNKTATVNFFNLWNLGNLKIIKKDKNTGEKLGGATFSITGPNNYKMTVTTPKASTSTETLGEIKIKNLVPGKYTIKETKAPDNYNLSDPASQTVEVKASKDTYSTVTFQNEIKKGKIVIIKKDANTGKPLANVGFTLQLKESDYLENSENKKDIIGQYVKKGSNNNTSYVQSPVTLYTDSNGRIEIPNLWPGKYELKETYMPYEGYYKDNELPKVIDSNINIASNQTREINVTNQRKYINLSGYVWEDIADQLKGEGKETSKNGLYKESNDTKIFDRNDKLVEGVTVQLKSTQNSNGNPIDTKITDSKGRYTFENVEIDKLNVYYIEFQYNGMCYQSVTPHTNKDNGSKASEGNARTTFNNEYATITKGKSNEHDLKYTEQTNGQQQTSQIKYAENISNYNYGYKENEDSNMPVSGVDEQYIIKANTRDANNGMLLGATYNSGWIRENGTTVIDNINLGIEKREQPNLMLTKTVQNVKVEINGDQHIYNFEKLNKKNNNNNDLPINSPQVEYEPYNRALYASDIKYNGTEDKKLKVYVTYKLAIDNLSTVDTRVNEIADYYDTKFVQNSIKVGTDIENDGSIKVGTEIKTEDKVEKVQEYELQKNKIQPNNLLIEGNTTSSIYVRVQVEPKNIIDIVDKNAKVELNNLAEITSYSALKDGKAYAGIDTNSQPDNISIKDILKDWNNMKSEDDSSRAGTIKLILQEERKISGNVFVDNTELKNNIRQGNGTYDNGEKGIKDVKVKLMTSDGYVAEYYDIDNKVWKKAENILTDANGAYTIGGILPDEYQVIYTWGDKTYKVQDYKATVITKAESARKDGDKEWYKTLNPRYSDATDNYATRTAIDKQTEKMTNANKKVIEQYTGQIELSDGTKQNLITTMDSTTPTFKVNVEYNGPSTRSEKEEYELDKNGEIRIENGYVVKKEEYRNHLMNIDFGIAERPKQTLQLDKYVKNAKITLANGSVLIDAEVIEENGVRKLKDNVKHAVYLPTSNADGQIKMEVDDEIIQGATLEIKYGFKTTNISELDYQNEEFYRYGKGYGEVEGQKVKLRADTIVDYIDNNLSLSTPLDEEGKLTLRQGDAKNELITQGLLENKDSMKQLLTQTDKVICSTELSKTLLKPNEEAQTDTGLTGYKLIANADEVALENDAEIIQITKTGGSTITTTPGNYIPAESEHEVDDSQAESVTIMPPTGDTTNYIAYIITAISSLGIMLAGIILIKKFILKK